MSTTATVHNITYRTTQGTTRTGWYDGVTHGMTGEVWVGDDRTGNRLYVKPETVTLIDTPAGTAFPDWKDAS